MSLELKIARLDKSVEMPSYAHADDAAFDLPAYEKTVIKAGERVSIPTGIKMEIPEGYVGLIWDKSGLSHKSGLKTLGGVIDSGYRGEIKVGMINLSDKKYIFEKNDHIAQMIIQKKEKIVINEASKLSETDRGQRGFGSTTKK